MADTFAPAQIVEATDSRVSLADLRNWIREGLFNTKMKEPRAGHPRQFPELAVYEAVLLSRFSAFGVPLAKAKKWNATIIDRIAKQGVATIHTDGSQYGPTGGFGAPQIVVFDPEGDMQVLSDTEGGATANRLLYTLQTAPGPKAAIGVLHLPALLSPVRRSLGIPQ